MNNCASNCVYVHAHVCNKWREFIGRLLILQIFAKQHKFLVPCISVFLIIIKLIFLLRADSWYSLVLRCQALFVQAFID